MVKESVSSREQIEEICAEIEHQWDYEPGSPREDHTRRVCYRPRGDGSVILLYM